MKKKIVEKGSLLGGTLLVAGSAIGAGMLGLPLVTGISGFYPAVVVFVFCWLFMTSTALLLLEVNLSFSGNINLISMTRKFLGQGGAVLCYFTYLSLFYCTLVAYIDASGSISQNFAEQKLNWIVSYNHSALFFTLLFGFFVYLGTLFVDQLNRLFMLGLIATYFLVLGLGAPEVKGSFHSHQVWGYSLLAIPVTISSFGYHNIIPTMTHYVRKNRRKMISMIFLGGALPLLIYILWDWLMLGVVPVKNLNNELSLKDMIGYIQAPLVGVFVQYFAFFAIVTSFLAQALALVDFLRDALKIKDHWAHRIWLVALVLAPPYIFAILYPGVFISALGLVGGFFAIILFVFMPALMVWKLRYQQKNIKHLIVPGGRIILTLIMFIGAGIMLIQFNQKFLR